jgi:hypothetical protein
MILPPRRTVGNDAEAIITLPVEWRAVEEIAQALRAQRRIGGREASPCTYRLARTFAAPLKFKIVHRVVRPLV